MFGWFQRLLPKSGDFFVLFERHGATMIEAAQALVSLTAGEGDRSQLLRTIRDQEHAADEVIREVLHEVRHTFLTPFDRGAITALIGAMDDTIDEMNATASAIELLEVETFDPQMRQIGVRDEARMVGGYSHFCGPLNSTAIQSYAALTWAKTYDMSAAPAGVVQTGTGTAEYNKTYGKIYNNTNGNDCWDATMTPSNDDVTIPDNTCDTIDYNGAAQTTFPGTDSTGGAGWLDVNLTPTDPAGDTMSWNQMVYNWYVGGSG